MRNVDEGADEIGDSRFEALPERVRVALGELAGAAKEGLLALSVGVGLGVLTELMAEEVDDVCRTQGPPRCGARRGPPRPRGGQCDARRPASARAAPAGARPMAAARSR
jgi:hypothetical protein